MEKVVFCLSCPQFDPMEGVDYLEHIVYIGKDLDEEPGAYDIFDSFETAYDFARNLSKKNGNLEIIAERLC